MRSNFTKYAVVTCFAPIWLAFVGGIIGGLMACPSPRHSTGFGATSRLSSPEAVIVTSDSCSGRFSTAESTAFQADQRGKALECNLCENGDQPALPSGALEDPTVDEVRTDLTRNCVGHNISAH